MTAKFLPPRCLRCHHAPRGGTLIELLVGCVIALLTGGALVSLQQSSYVANASVQGQNYANASSRRPLDILGDTLRNAQIGAGTNQALVSASASDVTCYTAMGTSRIYLDTNAHALKREKDNGMAAGAAFVASPEILVANVTSLQLTYYIAAGNAYNADVSGWTTTADPHSPSDAELPNVGAVNIVTTISANGETRTLQSFIRMRNSPNTNGS